MASGLMNPKNSREAFGHDPNRRPWKPRAQAQAPRIAVDNGDSDDYSNQSFTGDGIGLNGYSVFENRVRIALNSCSKLDIRELRRRLTNELDQVRSLVKKLEASSSYSNSKKEFGVSGTTQSQFSSNLESAMVKPSFKKNNKKNSTKSLNLSNESLKNCSNLLEKLMKHKFGWVFNAPVDFKALGLLDYRKIIKRPMDLGTVKSKLTKGLYESASDFAEDVRLTFRNAMLYNPKGQDVHSMAEKLLEIFEERWENDQSLKKLQIPSENEDKIEKNVMKKPKAKEAEKPPRDMTFEEKQRLSTSLQSLPSEKLDNVVQIIKKRNIGLCQQDDEIEVDIASVDPETLWELDRFVTNYTKGLMSSSNNKNKRKAETVVPQSRVVDKNVAHKSSRTESESEGSLGSGSAYRS